MIEIAVGSQNPSKLSAADIAFRECLGEPFSITGYSVESGVSDQPMNDDEMFMGARNRVFNASRQAPDARYLVGMEGGMRVMRGHWFNLGWVCVQNTATGKHGYGVTLAHRVPDDVQTLMQEDGLELSDAVTAVYGTDTVSDRDCSGVITGGLLPADKVYALGIIAAFADTQTEQIVL